MIPAVFTDGPRFGGFCEHYCLHTKGRWSGRPFVLEGWQQEFWDEALEINPATGLRVYQEIGLGIPRKNGKSMQASSAGLYGLVADNEAEPEVYVGASFRGQANIVLGQSRSIVRRSPRLLRIVQPQMHRLLCPANDGIMRSVSSDGPMQTGLNPSWSIIDEIHAHKNPDLYDALTTGTGAREQPVTFWITTAGGGPDGLLFGLYEQMFSGSGELERRDGLLIYRDRPAGVLIYWYGANRHDDIADPEVWRKCNPASWLQDLSYLTAQYRRLKARGELIAWRTYHLNQFVSHEEAWLPDGVWERAGAEFTFNPALPVGVGVFKVAESDRAAIVVAQRQGERVFVEPHHFEANVITGRVDTEKMRMFLRQLRREFPAPAMRHPKTRIPLRGPAVAFDEWAFSESAEMLEHHDGLNMVDFPQYSSTMGPATTQAYEMVNTGRILHSRDEALTEQIATSSAILTDRGMKLQVTKEPKSLRNPAAIAMVMAVSMVMEEAPKQSVRKARVGVGF